MSRVEGRKYCLISTSYYFIFRENGVSFSHFSPVRTLCDVYQRNLNLISVQSWTYLQFFLLFLRPILTKKACLESYLVFFFFLPLRFSLITWSVVPIYLVTYLFILFFIYSCMTPCEHGNDPASFYFDDALEIVYHGAEMKCLNSPTKQRKTSCVKWFETAGDHIASFSKFRSILVIRTFPMYYILIV